MGIEWIRKDGCDFKERTLQKISIGQDMNGALCIGGSEVTVLPVLLVLARRICTRQLKRTLKSRQQNTKVVQNEIKYLHHCRYF